VSEEILPLRHALVEGARRWGLEHPVETAKVFGNWKDLVGDQVAARCEPAGLSHGVLRVWAATPTWASELRYLAPEVIRRVNAGVGAPVVRELKVSLRPPPARDGPARYQWDPFARPAAERPRPVPVRSTHSSGAGIDADALVVDITDEKLAAATKRALLAAKTHPKRA
jgi:hypothetical protein